MMKLKQLCPATVLTLAFAFTAFAGNMDTPGVTSPPPIQPSATSQMDISGVTDSETTTTDSVTGLALYLFNSMIPVF